MSWLPVIIWATPVGSCCSLQFQQATQDGLTGGVGPSHASQHMASASCHPD